MSKIIWIQQTMETYCVNCKKELWTTSLVFEELSKIDKAFIKVYCLRQEKFKIIKLGISWFNLITFKMISLK